MTKEYKFTAKDLAQALLVAAELPPGTYETHIQTCLEPNEIAWIRLSVRRAEDD